MPKLLIIRNLVFLIFSVDIRENRLHIHIVNKSVRVFRPAKIWLEPEVSIAERGDFSEKEMNLILKLAIENKDILEQQIQDYFSGKKIQIIKK